MIVASGGSRVLFASKHVIALWIKRKRFARAHRPSQSMRFKHCDRRAHTSADSRKVHPKVQTDASNRSLSSHVSHPRKRAPLEVSNLLLFSRRCRIRRLSIRVDRVGLWKVLI